MPILENSSPVIIEKVWIVIPIPATTTPIDEATYLVSRGVAEYIEQLECRIAELEKNQLTTY